MYWIIAFIRPTALEPVRIALSDVGIQSLTISECVGQGRQGGKTEMYRGHEYTNALIPKVRCEVACSQGELKFALEAFQKGACTPGSAVMGEGKIFVFSLEECVRIRTGEAGKNAI